jgi:ligand-binding SRPBCC domain-containing protein
MKFDHRFRLRAPVEVVGAFHGMSQSLAAITPPPIVLRLSQAPGRLGEGDEVSFTLWIGPLPLRWHARIENVSPVGFVDRQFKGPFSSWEHKHTFVALGATETEIRDEMEACLSPHVIWAPIGWAMWLGLPALFAFRALKTRRILETR